MKPGTELYWWQSKIAADMGYVVGLPVLIAVLKSPFSGLANELFGWFCAVAWTIGVYFLFGAGIRSVRKLYVGIRNLTHHQRVG
jgi:hypothetical protein